MSKHTYFQEECFCNSKYKLWIVRVKDTEVAKYSLCKWDTSLSNIVCSALDDHTYDKKQKQKVKEKQKCWISYFKSNTCITSKGQENSVMQRINKKELCRTYGYK